MRDTFQQGVIASAPGYKSPGFRLGLNADAMVGIREKGEEAARLNCQDQGICGFGVRVCVLGAGTGQAVRPVTDLGDS